MKLIYRVSLILLLFNCILPSNLLTKREIIIESNYRYVVADGIDKVSFNIIEETLEKGAGSQREIYEFELLAESLTNNSLNQSIVVEGKDIKFNTPDDYEISVIYNGKKIKKSKIIKARRDLKNIYHISKNSEIELVFRDNDEEIIPDVEFKDQNGNEITSKNLENLRDTEEIILEAFLRGSKLGTLTIHMHDVKLESINNIIVEGEENRLKFDIRNKNKNILNYSLVYKNEEEGKVIISNSNLLDFEKIVTNYAKNRIERYVVYALVEVEFQEAKYEVKTNNIDVYVLNKWKREEKLISSQALKLSSMRSYKNFGVKIFSKYEDEDEKEIDFNKEFICNKIGFVDIILKYNNNEVGRINIEYSGIIDIKQDDKSIIFGKLSKREAYLDLDNLENFSYLIRNYKGEQINFGEEIEWHLLIDENYEKIESLSELKDLDDTKEYRLKFIYSSSSYKIESSCIFIKLFNKSGDFNIERPLLGSGKAELENIKYHYVDSLSIYDSYSEKNTSSTSDNFKIYKQDNRVYITPLKAFEFDDEVNVKIGNTHFCKIKIKVNSSMVEEIDADKWIGIANQGNTCFANSAFKFLSSFRLIDHYLSSQDKLMNKNDYDIEIFQYLKGIINGIRLGADGSFSCKEVGGFFIRNFLTKFSLFNKELDPKAQDFGNGAQHDAIELIDEILKIFINDEENSPSVMKLMTSIDKNLSSKSREESVNSLNLSLKGSSSQESLDDHLYIEKVNILHDLYKLKDKKIRFKKNNCSRYIEFKNIDDLKSNLNKQEFFIIDSNKEKEHINVIENELLNIIEKGGELEDKKRYKIIFENEIEYFILVEISKYTNVITLFIGMDYIDIHRQIFIQECKKNIYLNFKRIEKKDKNIVIVSTNRSIDEEIKINLYNRDFLKEEVRYKLTGAIVHSGGTQGGHYYAYIKCRNGWTKQNDSYVSKIDKLPECSYCSLIYEKIE